MQREASAALRRFWYLLWLIALAPILAMLFATLRDRPFDPLALNYFTLDVLEKGRQFTREVRVAGTAQLLLSLAFLLWLCFHRAGARLLHWLEGLGRGRLSLGLAAVSTGITLLVGLIELPADLYLGFFHEHAYGLSRETLMEWLSNHFLSLGLHAVIMLLLWVPLYWLIRRWPRGWWVPAALFNVALSGFIVLISPLLFLPLQGQLVPVTDPKLLAMVDQVAQKSGVQVGAVRELIVSHKTSRVNAMVTGLGATKQVVLYDTLLQQFSPAEVQVVMAHELSHAVHRDVATAWLFSGAVEGLALCAAAWMLRGMVGVGHLAIKVPHAARGVALFILFTALFGQVTAPVHNALSRRMEVRADQFALEVTGNTQAFIRTFRKLAAGNPSDVDPPALVEWLSHSHPSIMNRIRTAIPE